MTTPKDEVVHKIGNMIGQAANASAEHWDYAGYMFVAAQRGGSPYLFANGEYGSLNTRLFRRDLRENFLRLRDLTQIEGDDPWIRCLAMIRFEDRALRILFEFEDTTRWAIGPTNVHDAYRIIVGDAFPEDFQ
ncbi:hypothetical protein EU803_04360 [Loktanella sp. IMCC34160]|uniref:hypothetical protein n=1 Tax=Loktanella sp. IMCC34160 TaxID=2510646 RepID=UPI0010E7A2F5|nr:hypothetical protein [Loktanella sp. IMCC34160]RYG93337.1 hypothetical protein EU803_04360 [Loktanella sp. IMCC34160]